MVEERVSQETPIQWKENSQALNIDLDGEPYLILMRAVAEDRFGNDDKQPNAVELTRRNVAGVADQTWNVVGFDTPINAFPAEYYHRVAKLDEVTLVARFSAPKWRARLMCRQENSVPRMIAQQSGSGDADLSFKADLAAQPNRIYLELAFLGDLSIELIAWATPAPKVMPVLGLSITTYNKPDYLRPNLDILRESASFGAGFLDVLVVNNGDPLDGVPEGIEVKPLNNVGGTGGFLAGHAHFKAKGYRHFVIMDDDIAIPADFVDRLYALSCLTTDYHIGSLAEILNTDQRLIKEQGGVVQGEHIFGLHLNNPNLLLDGAEKHQLYGFHEVDFSGWWSLLVDLDGPAPKMPEKQFIKRDDIMFGYESRVQGMPTVVMPNLIVAHGEEGSPAYYYYDIRNDLILRARSNAKLGISIKQLVAIAGMLMLTLRSDRQRMFNMALVDFMAGEKRLEKSDIGRNLRKVRGCMLKPMPLPEEAEVLEGGERPSLRNLALNWLRPSAWRRSAEVPVIASNPLLHTLGRGQYIDPIPYSENGYLRTRRMSLIFRFLYSCVLIFWLAIRRKNLVRAYTEGAAS